MAATKAKGKNGTAPAEAVADVTAKAAAEAQAMIDGLLEAADKFSENSKSVLAVQQKFLQAGFEAWQQYSKTYSDFFIKVAQEAAEQNFAARENLSKIFEDNAKRSQELFVAEQKLSFEATEAFQAQMQAATERFADIFTPVSN